LTTILLTTVLLMIVSQTVAQLPSAGLDRGFLRLYDLDFTGAQKEFEPGGEIESRKSFGAVERGGWHSDFRI
jgi:hypothetical protein